MITICAGLSAATLQGSAYSSGGRRVAEVEVGKIKESEVHQLSRRRESLNLWGLSFGPYSVRNMETDELVYAFALTNHREVSERAEIRFRLGAGISEKANAHSASMTIGGAFMPFTGDVTPVMGGEFGFGYAAGKKVDTAAGFAGAGILGLRFFRTSTTHMELTGRYETYAKSNDVGKPATYGVQLAILF